MEEIKNSDNTSESKFGRFRFREGEINPETGLTYDYLNELYKILLPLQTASSDEQIVKYIQEHPLIHYQDNYPGYADLVTDQNQEAIGEINSLVDEANSISLTPDLRSRLQEINNRIRAIIGRS